MARPLRLELPRGIYYGTARGYERGSIFRGAIARASREDDYRMREIAGALGCHYATISCRLRTFEKDGCRSATPDPGFLQDLTPHTREPLSVLMTR